MVVNNIGQWFLLGKMFIVSRDSTAFHGAVERGHAGISLAHVFCCYDVL